ncbi:NADH/Ubiquinone/plastoquinone (complex I) [Hirschia baltica ATCC 49814]|uniref:NADH/Ubiquinone/plastoquinone (Complex I) n=2 Tax=Hirschia TaxID=2723 RepID=C6XI90_HIRBI|nr:NADH/Ubiquinone/plastoquinone (complex I) [Hirschia baltica ATCC 49814]
MFANFHLAPEALTHHAPVLLVLVPFLMATATVFAPNGRFAWGMALLTSAFTVWMAWALGADVAREGVVSYHMGGWAPPLGIEFRVDGLNTLIVILISFMALMSALFAQPAVAREIKAEKQPLFYTAYQICLAGLMGMSLTGDAFNLFVFLEISSISTYVLVALGATRDRRALTAAFNYLIMGTIGASFFVIGVGFLYAATGTLNMADIAERLNGLHDSRVVQAGFAFIIVGLGLKAAMFPLHQWLPSAYAYAPSFVTVFLSATATKAAFYALARFIFTVFDPSWDFVVASLNYVLAPAACLAILFCSFQAIFQLDVRRVLAYSSVAQVGYMLLGLSVGTAAGLSAGMFHLANHALLKGALFMAVGAAALGANVWKVSHFKGAGKKAPLTFAAFTIAGLSLMGVPLTAGFLSKWRLLEAVMINDWWWAALVIGASSFLAFFYVGRILQAVYFMEPDEGAPEIKEAPLVILFALWVLAGLNIFFGVNPSIPLGLAEAGAHAVLGIDLGGVQ